MVHIEVVDCNAGNPAALRVLDRDRDRGEHAEAVRAGRIVRHSMMARRAAKSEGRPRTNAWPDKSIDLPWR